MDARLSTPELLTIFHDLSARHTHFACWNSLAPMLEARLTSLYDAPECAYMPSYKCLDLMHSFISRAVAIAEATQLRMHESRALLNHLMDDDTIIIRQFRLEAALEHARYAPLMLHETPSEGAAFRDALLKARWNAMLAAHQNHYPLGTAVAKTVRHHVAQMMQAECFRDYRIGPMLQLFAECLRTAREIEARNESAETLAALLSPAGRLWRSYALKSSRYAQTSPIHASVSLPASPHVH